MGAAGRKKYRDAGPACSLLLLSKQASRKGASVDASQKLRLGSEAWLVPMCSPRSTPGWSTEKPLEFCLWAVYRT